MLEATSLPLGLDETAIIPTGAPLTLVPGQVLLLFTDGFSEAMSPTGELFSTARVLDLVHRHRDRPANEILAVLYQAILRFSHPAPLKDDATAVVLKVLAEP